MSNLSPWEALSVFFDWRTGRNNKKVPCSTKEIHRISIKNQRKRSREIRRVVTLYIDCMNVMYALIWYYIVRFTGRWKETIYVATERGKKVFRGEISKKKFTEMIQILNAIGKANGEEFRLFEKLTCKKERPDVYYFSWIASCKPFVLRALASYIAACYLADKLHLIFCYFLLSDSNVRIKLDRYK